MNETTKTRTHSGSNFSNKYLLLKKAHQKQSWLKWLAVFGAFLFQAIPYGVADNILGNMEPYVVDGGTLSDGSFYYGLFGGHPVIEDGGSALMGNFVIFTMVFTFGSIISALFSPLIGKLFGSKINLKFLLATGCFISGFSFAMVGLMGVIWPATDPANMTQDFAAKAVWLYFWYGMCLVGAITFSGLGIPYVIGAWVPGRGRGTVLGIAYAGGSAGNLVWQVAINQSLAHISVYHCFFIYGAVGVAGGILISMLLINMPKTFAVSNTSQTKLSSATSNDIATNGAGLQTTLTIPYFYMLCASYGVFALGIAGCASQWPTFVHQGLYLVAKDIVGPGGDPTQYLANAATIIGVAYGVSCLIGNLAGGYLFSKLNTSGAFAIGGSIRVVGSLCMLLGAYNPYLVILGVGLSGFTCYTYTSATGFMSTSLFGRKDSSVVIGLISIGFAIGFAISAPILSGIQTSSVTSSVGGHTLSGQWVGVWVFTAAAIALGTILFVASSKKIEKLGYVGMANANFSRYGRKLTLYHPYIYIKALKIWLTGKDDRLTLTYLKLVQEKQKKDLAKASERNRKEAETYSKQTKKIDQRQTQKANKLNHKINELNAKISGLQLSSDEQKQIAIKLKKYQDQVNRYEAKINEAYDRLIAELINQVKSLHATAEINDLNNLISLLQSDSAIPENYYDNNLVKAYFVKYASYMMKIQQAQKQIEIQTNPKAYKLNQKLKQAETKLNNVTQNHTFQIQRAGKAHNQIMVWNVNKYYVLNQLVDQKVQDLEDEKRRVQSHKIDLSNEEIQKHQEKIQHYESKLNNIQEMWSKNDIHHTLVTIPDPKNAVNNTEDPTTASNPV